MIGDCADCLGLVLRCFVAGSVLLVSCVSLAFYVFVLFLCIAAFIFVLFALLCLQDDCVLVCKY